MHSPAGALSPADEMSEPMSVQLGEIEAAIRRGLAVLRDHPELVKTEMCVRYAVIDPILRALGWDTSNLRECELEFPREFVSRGKRPRSG